MGSLSKLINQALVAMACLTLSQVPSAYGQRLCRSAHQGSIPQQVSVFADNKAQFAKKGSPAFLSSSFPFLSVIQSLENTTGGLGTGFHIGDGFILTNRHVYNELAGGYTKTIEFKGFEKIEKFPKDRELYLVALPKPSEADTKAMSHSSGLMRNGLHWNEVLKYNDWALVFDAAIKNNAKLDQFRSTETLRPDETLWILGRPEAGQKGALAVASFQSRHDQVSILKDTDLMGGFSGSPVVDSNGKVVGVIFGFVPGLRQASMMNIEVVMKAIEGLRTAPPPLKKPSSVPLFSRFVNNGKAETIVFIHGNGDSIASFSSIEALLPQTHNYLFYDQRGHGQSKYDGVDYRLKTMVDDLDSVIAGAGLQKVHLVAHSFGARIALAYAASRPQTVKSLVVEDMDFTLRDPGGEKSIDQYALRFQSLLRTYPSMNDAIRAVSLVYGNDNQVLASVLTQVTYRQEPNGGVTLLSAPIAPYVWGAYANANDLSGALKSYPGSLLFMRANVQASAMSDVGLAQIKQLKPNSTVLNFPNSSHSIHSSQPADFTKAVLGFISQAP